MANTIKMLLWVHRSKSNKDGMAPLILRLSYLSQRTQKSTGYYINAKDWNAEKQRARGTKKESVEVNNRIQELSAKLLLLGRGMGGETNIHLPMLISQLFAPAREEPLLLRFFNEHNSKLQERVGKDFARSTYEKYVFTYNKVKAFVTVRGLFGKGALKFIWVIFSVDLIPKTFAHTVTFFPTWLIAS